MKDISKKSHLKLYKQCNTMAEYFYLIQSSGLDYYEFFNNISKRKIKDCFRKVTRISNINLKSNIKVADAENTTKILPSEQSKLSKYNFNYGYNAYTIKGNLDLIVKRLNLHKVDAE